MRPVSTRADIITRRTYNRPTNEEGTAFETWQETITRVIKHQQWLWERQQGFPITLEQASELYELEELMLDRKVSLSGRTLWMGGTEVSKRREASMFNCSFSEVQTVHDVVDSIWLLLQGCGFGFRSIVGVINGFSKEIPNIEIIRSKRTRKGGRENNYENVFERTPIWPEKSAKEKVWYISVGDSAEAWAKTFGKLIAGKQVVDRLIVDLQEIRPPGERLKGYGWISSGDEALAKAIKAIIGILNRRAGKLLTRIDLLDLENWLGTILASRRSSEIALHRFGEDEWEEFVAAKSDFSANPQRVQSNNSLMFYHKPTKLELRGIFELMLENGGSEPGFINVTEALQRAPWFKGLNPCAEILMGNKSFCNLVETNLSRFNDDYTGLMRAHYLLARANYRQTCVNLRDGMLQDTWHELNEFLRLTGVGVTGIAQWNWKKDKYAWMELKASAQAGLDSMADELGLPRSKAGTTIKPSGTLSKIMDTTEGVHTPMGRYIFNNVNFGKHDPLIEILRAAGYRVWDNPSDPEGTLVTFPVEWKNIEFTEVRVPRATTISTPEVEVGTVCPYVTLHVNTESAVDQLERYKFLMEYYVDHNCSITVSYDPDEVPAIVEWLDKNWDAYVGVSWLLRTSPTKTAGDLGFPYLPQEVVTKEDFEIYTAQLQPIDINKGNSLLELTSDECASGVCPVR